MDKNETIFLLVIVAQADVETASWLREAPSHLVVAVEEVGDLGTQRQLARLRAQIDEFLIEAQVDDRAAALLKYPRGRVVP